MPLWCKILWGLMAKKSTAAGAAMATTKAKVGLSVTGLVAVATMMFSYVDNRIADVKSVLAKNETSLTRYVDIRHEQVKEDLQEIKTGIQILNADIKQILRELK